MRALVFAGLATTSNCIIKQWKGINVGNNILLKKKKDEEKKEENTYETILIQKISCITVKITKKKKEKKKELFKDFNLSTFVIVRNLTIWLIINKLETDI